MLSFCQKPFTDLHVRSNSYTICCDNWFTDKSGKEVQVFGEFDDYFEMWNNPKFLRLRRYWLRKDSGMCKNCPLLLNNNNFPHLEKEEDFMRSVNLDIGPRNIFFANDLTCQLHCWSCRSKPIIEKKQEKIFKQTYDILYTFKESIKFISTLGSGDPFASPSWLKILKTFRIEEFSDLKIELFTNGILLPKHWDSLSHIHDNIAQIKMSVDASSKEIYEKTRLGGKYEDMDDAMKFISKLGKDFIVNMCVQSDNFTDIPHFIERAIKYNATKVNLTLLQFWNQMRGGIKTFNEKSLANPNHVKRKQFIKLLNDNQGLLNNPIVDCSKLKNEFLNNTYLKNKK